MLLFDQEAVVHLLSAGHHLKYFRPRLDLDPYCRTGQVKNDPDLPGPLWTRDTKAS